MPRGELTLVCALDAMATLIVTLLTSMAVLGARVPSAWRRRC